jgi:hypothetical protein
MTRRTLFPLVFAFLALPGRSQAQDTPKPEATKPETSAERRGPTATLRVQLVITRFQGEKKLASLPYTFVVTAGGNRARMRMGVDTPIPTTTTSSDTLKALTSYQYKNVGTNIDCIAFDRKDGLYQLSIGVENSSALALEKGPSGAVNPGGPRVDANPTGIPLFRRFETNLDPLMRDGQSVQTVAATDPVTGEVVKIDVTMNVVK